MGAQMGPPEVGGQQGKESLISLSSPPQLPSQSCPHTPRVSPTQSLALDLGLKVNPVLAGLSCVSWGTRPPSWSLCGFTCATTPIAPVSSNACKDHKRQFSCLAHSKHPKCTNLEQPPGKNFGSSTGIKHSYQVTQQFRLQVCSQEN